MKYNYGNILHHVFQASIIVLGCNYLKIVGQHQFEELLSLMNEHLLPNSLNAGLKKISHKVPIFSMLCITYC